jgi:GNAT superfamily N-acetyltransferase
VIELRKMTRQDVPLGMRLKDQAGWNQTEQDWRRFLDLEPEGCFVAIQQGRPVGTVAAFAFGLIGWIAMVLVDRSARHCGIGTRLVEQALEYLDTRAVDTVRLDATELGRPIYETLGFVAEYELLRLQGTAQSTPVHPNVRLLPPERFAEVLELDLKVTATHRGRLLQALHREAPDAFRTFAADQTTLGYITIREGARATQIGPGVASNEEAGRALIEDALSRCQEQPVLIDIPVDNLAALACAESHGLTAQRPFIRMRRGNPVDDDPTRLWASSGPEKG